MKKVESIEILLNAIKERLRELFPSPLTTRRYPADHGPDVWSISVPRRKVFGISFGRAQIFTCEENYEDGCFPASWIWAAEIKSASKEESAIQSISNIVEEELDAFEKKHGQKIMFLNDIVWRTPA